MRKLFYAVLLFVLPLFIASCNGTAEVSLEATMELESDAMTFFAEGATADSASTEEDVLALYTPTPVPTPTPIPTPTPVPTPPPYEVEDITEKNGYVTKGGVNLRSGPHTAYDVITVLDMHSPITLTGKSQDWYQVEYLDTTGFLSAEFVEVGAVPTPKVTPKPYTVERMASTTAYVNSGSVNFRSGPGRSYDILAEAERYEKVTINGTCGDWYRVKYNKKTGYMLKSYVRIGISPAGYESVGKYTPADVLILAQIAYRESARSDAEGYKAVASVVLNRVKSGKYPNSIEKVVFQGNGAQFSPAENANKLRMTKPSAACVNAVREVLADGPIFPSNIMYFRTASKGTTWSSARTYYGTYGGNCYFS